MNKSKERLQELTQKAYKKRYGLNFQKALQNGKLLPIKRNFKEQLAFESELFEKTIYKKRIELYRKRFGNYWIYITFKDLIYIPIEVEYFACIDKVNTVHPQIDENNNVCYPQTLLSSLKIQYTFEEYTTKFCIKKNGKYYYKK